jgi:hypothetical protein
VRPDADQLAPGSEAHRWEQQPGETARAYSLFAIYRDLGPLRTLRRAAASFYHSHPELEDADRLEALTAPQLQQARFWSHTHGWVERAQAWDLHLDEIGRFEQEVRAREMRVEYRVLASDLRQRIRHAINSWISDDRILSPLEAIRALEVCQKIESWALEVPAEIATPRETPDDARELAEHGKALVAELRLADAG